MADTSTTTFDYTILPAIDRITVRDCTEEVHGFIHRTGRDAHRIGRKLTAVKTLLGHGRFLAWLRAEFNWSVDTAERLMKVAERFPEIPHRAEIGQSALYVLTGKGVPEEARREALARAGAGEAITKSVAREIKDKYLAPANSGTGNKPPGGVGSAGECDARESDDTAASGEVPPKPTAGIGGRAKNVPALVTVAPSKALADNSTTDPVPALPVHMRPLAPGESVSQAIAAEIAVFKDVDTLLNKVWPPAPGDDPVETTVRRMTRDWPTARRAELARWAGELGRRLRTASEALTGKSQSLLKSAATETDR